MVIHDPEGSDVPESVDNRTLQLELKAMRGEFRLWLLAAVIANTALSHIILPPVVGYASAGLFLVAVAVKVMVLAK